MTIVIVNELEQKVRQIKKAFINDIDIEFEVFNKYTPFVLSYIKLNKIDVVITEIEFDNEINLNYLRWISKFSEKTKLIVQTSSKNWRHENQCRKLGVKYFFYESSSISVLKNFVMDISYILQNLKSINRNFYSIYI